MLLLPGPPRLYKEILEVIRAGRLSVKEECSDSVHIRATSQTRDWEPVTITLQAHSLVEKTEPAKFTLHFAWGTKGVFMWIQDGCKSPHGFLHGIAWIMFHGLLDYFSEPPLGGRPNTKPKYHMTLDAHICWFILFYYARGPGWIEVHWNSIWLRVRSHMASQYTWGSVTTLLGFGGVLVRPLDTFFWALTISWSRLLACVWSGPKLCISRVVLKHEWQSTSNHHCLQLPTTLNQTVDRWNKPETSNRQSTSPCSKLQTSHHQDTYYNETKLWAQTLLAILSVLVNTIGRCYS